MSQGTSAEDRTRELEEARALAAAGKPATALERVLGLEQWAARQPPSDSGSLFRARAALTRGLLDFEIHGDLKAALAIIKEAESHLSGSPRHPYLAAIQGQRGLLFLRSGDLERAVRALDRALELDDVASDFDLATVLLNRGTALMELGRLREAAVDLARCTDVAQGAGLTDLALKSRHNHGYVDFLAGRIPQALSAMHQAQDLGSGERHPIGMLDEARVLREAGLFREADHLLAAAAEAFAAEKLTQDLAETSYARAECALLDGDAAGAVEFAREALAIFVERGNIRWQRRAELLVLRCQRAAVVDDWPQARHAVLDGVAMGAEVLAAQCEAEDRSDLAEEARLLAAECRLRNGARVPDPLSDVRHEDSLDVRLLRREVAALLAWGTGDHTMAFREVKRGVDDLSRYQNRFGSLDLRTATATHGRSVARLALDMALELGSPEAVFAAVERPRAASTRLPRITPPADEIAAEWLSELRQVEERIRDLEGVSRDDPEGVRLRRRAAELTDDIRGRSWQLTGDPTGRVGVAVDAEEVSTVLGGDEAWVSFAAHRGVLLAVVVEQDGARTVALGSSAEPLELVRQVRADLDVLAIGRLAASMRASVRQHLSISLDRLDTLLLVPLGLDGRPVTISATGLLTVLPWGMLPSRSGTATVVAPSASAWVERQNLPELPDPTVVAVAGPDVPEASSELQGVRTHWTSASLVEGPFATSARLAEVLGLADLVHVAAHGVHRHDNPLFSSLRMVDGPLFAHEIDRVGRVPACVVLSSCEVGLSTLRPGDEGLGLTSALLHFGARSVVSGIARVRDEVAAATMTAFHARLVSGEPVAAALAHVQADFADLDAPAPFVCFGASWSIA